MSDTRICCKTECAFKDSCGVWEFIQSEVALGRLDPIPEQRTTEVKLVGWDD